MQRIVFVTNPEAWSTYNTTEIKDNKSGVSLKAG